MKDHIDSLAGVRDGSCVAKVGVTKVDAILDFREIFLKAGLEVVQSSDSVTPINERAGKVRTDESGDAGEQITGQWVSTS